MNNLSLNFFSKLGINDEIFVTKQQKNGDVHAPVKLKENLKETVKTTKIEPKNNIKTSNTKHDSIVDSKSTSSKPTEGILTKFTNLFMYFFLIIDQICR